MKWINAEQQITVTIYDEEHEEHLDKIMTVEEMLDTYTNEGCPTMYSEPEPHWIPCSERLPETDEVMLVTAQPKKGAPNVNRAYYMDGHWHGSGSMSNVVAWMPLPEPWKGEDDDEN